MDPLAELLHFLGEVEVVFGLWAVVLMVAIAAFYDWGTVVQYVSHDVNFTEAAFVVVIMTLAATRPTLKLVESIMLAVAGGGLTIIANAPNPAGQFLLKHHFGEAVSPLGLLAAALVPAIVVWMCFLLL